MRYHVLAVDFDGTLADNGRVDEPTLNALNKFLATGRHLVMVTGRELPELLAAFPQIDLFEWVVAENGGLLYRPSTKKERLITEPPSEKLIQALQRRGVAPLSVGKSILATWHPHETVVLESIRDLGLDLQIIFNKGAVMILPAGVNKAFGFAAALKEMGISEHNAVGIGDAENDHAFLRKCELSAAVFNALPAVKQSVDLVTNTDHGGGVAELIELIVADDLCSLDERLTRHYLSLGTKDGEEVLLPSYGSNVLICGPSGSGKSTVARRVVEAIMEQSYQFCLIDPEGDYEAFEGAVVLGGPKGLPQVEEVLHLLENPDANAVVCLTGMPIPDRPPFFLGLMSQLLQMRNLTGHPHWLILDEAHHLMPAEWLPPAESILEQLHNTLLITVQPNLLAEALLERVNTVIALGSDASQTLDSFAIATKSIPPAVETTNLELGELLLWMRGKGSPPVKVQAYPSKMECQRHHRKYAEGELPADRSFYFQGPEGKLNLRAQNLISFLQLADGVDDATWEHHLRRGDYSQWFRENIKDEALAATAQRIADLPNVSALESRQLIRTAVEQDYTLPASSPLHVPGAS
ncbi:MAG: HAD-IIB family hydrolase [Planctomycetota bacterium]